MLLGVSGLVLVATFMTLVMTKRATAIVALVLVPILFSLALGFVTQTGDFVAAGIERVAPTAVMLMFAILYFSIMIDAGMFQPLVRRIIAWAGDNPVRAIVGHAALASIVSLDGDGTTTALVTASALLPVYRRLGINPMIFGVIGGLCVTLMNMSPWGGPTARIAAALHVDPMKIFLPMLPTIGVGLAATFALAWYLGVKEKARLSAPGYTPSPVEANQGQAGFMLESDPAALRPGRVWINVALTVILMTAVVMHLAPLLVLFMVGTTIALVVNYPRLRDQRTRLMAHAGSVLNVATMVLAAGAFTGVLEGTKMIDAMSGAIVAVLPREFGPALGVTTALLSVPGTFFLSNDAYYFGVVPVIADTAAAYGIRPEEIGRAALLGQPIHGLSPLVAAVYLKCAILNIELADLQRFALKYFLLVTAVIILAAILTGAIPAIRTA